jgi:DNA integrity scanning protein DisA with diadenylate cyclase activity
LCVLLVAGRRLAAEIQAEAVLLLTEKSLNWAELGDFAEDTKFLVAADRDMLLDAATEGRIRPIPLEESTVPIHERLTQALLEAVADDYLQPGAKVVALYSGFDADGVDSISVVSLSEHLGRLTARDLQRLETRVPLDTLKVVVDLAVDIGREGREGKPVGTLFVVGDTRKVLGQSHPMGFDPVRGYTRKERNIDDRKVREAIKEIAQMDGAIIIAPDGTVEAAVRHLNAHAEGITLSKGLGARHWAAASISKATKAIAVAVSQSSGTVRLFQNGEVVLRIEPLRRAMKWQEFEHETPPAERD